MVRKKKGAICRLIRSNRVVKCVMKNGDVQYFVPKRRRKRKRR